MKKSKHSPKAKNIADEKSIAHSATSKKQTPPKGGKKISKRLPPPHPDTQLHRQITEQNSQYESHFDDYFKQGENPIAQIDNDLKERILLLFYLARGVYTPPGTKTEDLPNLKGEAIKALCSASESISSFLIELANGKSARAAERIWDNGVEMVSA